MEEKPGDRAGKPSQRKQGLLKVPKDFNGWALEEQRNK
jgi:hypothetical protein